MKIMSKLPERINAMRVVSYNVASIVETLVEMNAGDVKAEDVTLEEVLDIIGEWAVEDLANSRVGIIYQDENGEELE
jgi:hypothetical protein